MKKVKLLLLFFLAFNYFKAAFGQGLRGIGINTGIGITGMKFNIDKDKQLFQFSYEAGLISHILFNEGIGIMPSLDYAKISVKRTTTEPIVDPKTGGLYWDKKYNLNYMRLSVPLSVFLTDNYINFYFGFGPYFGFLMNAKYIWYDTSEENPLKGNFVIGTSESQDIKPMDYGLQLSGMMGAHKNGGINFILGGRLNLGLSDVSPKDATRIKTYSITANLILMGIFDR